MKPIVTLPEGVKAELMENHLEVGRCPDGSFCAGIRTRVAEYNTQGFGSTPEEAIANLEVELWKRAAISEK